MSFAVCFPTEHLGVVKKSLKRGRALRIDLEFGKVGFLERGENRNTQRKTSRKGREPTTNLPFHIPEAWKRGPFRSEAPHKGHYREYPPPPSPRGKEVSALTTAPPLHSFRHKPIQLLYLHKKVSSFMSISLIHNNYFAKFLPVHFLIQENVTLGILFAVCRKRHSKSLDFPLND